MVELPLVEVSYTFCIPCLSMYWKTDIGFIDYSTYFFGLIKHNVKQLNRTLKWYTSRVVQH